MLSMKVIQKSAVLCLTIFFVSCAGVKWNPDFYTIDKYNLQLVKCDNITKECKKVWLRSDEASKFTCIHEDKVLELYEILQNAYYFNSARTYKACDPLKETCSKPEIPEATKPDK